MVFACFFFLSFFFHFVFLLFFTFFFPAGTRRELQTCTFQCPCTSNTTKIPRKDPKREKEEGKLWREIEKKRAKFWAVRRRVVRRNRSCGGAVTKRVVRWEGPCAKWENAQKTAHNTQQHTHHTLMLFCLSRLSFFILSQMSVCFVPFTFFCSDNRLLILSRFCFLSHCVVLSHCRLMVPVGACWCLFCSWLLCVCVWCVFWSYFGQTDFGQYLVFGVLAKFSSVVCCCRELSCPTPQYIP